MLKTKDKTVSNLLKSYCKDHDLTCSELASKLRCPVRTLQAWMSGQRYPTPKALNKLIQLLDIKNIDVDVVKKIKSSHDKVLSYKALCESYKTCRISDIKYAQHILYLLATRLYKDLMFSYIDVIIDSFNLNSAILYSTKHKLYIVLTAKETIVAQITYDLQIENEYITVNDVFIKQLIKLLK